ncbi:MAG: hypothetical protein KBD66_01475 [Candidatus Doudnabacteria bacterium]|nr:hypothetical protein [Candidatus Doudnabacteria bacterium]
MKYVLLIIPAIALGVLLFEYLFDRFLNVHQGCGGHWRWNTYYEVCDKCHTRLR